MQATRCKLKNNFLKNSLSPRRERVRLRGRKQKRRLISLNGEEVRKTGYVLL